jgi:hypothetical protein
MRHREMRAMWQVLGALMAAVVAGPAWAQTKPAQTRPAQTRPAWSLTTQPTVRPTSRPAGSILRAGFAQVDISADRECSLAGYEFRFEKMPRGNDGVHDPLFVRALVIDDGSGPAVIVSIDNALIPTFLARILRQQLARDLDTVPDRVMVCATHTHSAPYLGMPRSSPSSQPVSPDWRTWPVDRPNARYTVMVIEKVRQAAAAARGLTFPMQLGVREAPLGIGYNRRVVTKEGLKVCWNPQEYPDRAPEPAADSTCTVVLLRQTNGPRQFLLWNLGVHPVALG